MLELENTSDNMVYLSTSDIAINGLVVNNSIWSCDAINPDKRCIVNVDLSTVLAPAYCDVYAISQVGAVSLFGTAQCRRHWICGGNSHRNYFPRCGLIFR